MEEYHLHYLLEDAGFREVQIVNYSASSIPDWNSIDLDRNAVARKLRYFADNVTLFITAFDFIKQRLVEAGFSKDRVVVVPYAITLAASPTDPSSGKYVVYAGCLSPEKGVDTFLDAACLLPKREFFVAGDGPLKKELEDIAPENVTFTGWLNQTQPSELYCKSRLAVVPSTWLEPFGLVVTYAMSNGLPVVASRIAGTYGQW